MRKIQIKIDFDRRAAAIYTRGKMISLSIPPGWSYFYIFNYRIDSDEAFTAFLNATACETEEELEFFIPILEGYVSNGRTTGKDYWREVLAMLNSKIDKADKVKLRKSHRSVDLVFKEKLFMFISNMGSYIIGENYSVINADVFVAIIRAALCETNAEMEIMTPMIEILDAEWKVKSKILLESLKDNVFD